MCFKGHILGILIQMSPLGHSPIGHKMALFTSSLGVNMKFDVALGLAFKEVRLDRGFTQDNFNLITDRAHISKLEHGKKKPHVHMINKYAAVMDVHPLIILTKAYLNENSQLSVEELLALVAEGLPKTNLTK
jgi:hypothetical protein